MKRKRRYREPSARLMLGVRTSESRIHDFFKGWGTICKDGSVLWDWWRPCTKRHAKKMASRLKKWDGKIVIPMINKPWPELLPSDIINVQPMRL